MLDIQLFRTDPDRVAKGIAAKKGDPAVVQTVVDLDTRRRDLTYRVEQLKKERNDTSKSIGKIMKEGGDAEPIKARMREVGDEIKALDEELNTIGGEIRDVLLRLPALPHESTPLGDSEDDNLFLRDWGEKPALDCEPKPHWELGETLGILDAERGAALSGSGFFVLKGQGARLQRALINFMLDMHVEQHGYTEARVPYVVNRQTITGTGQVPKSEFDMYRIESDDLFLIPTAEVPVTNFHAGDMLMAHDLPKAYCAYTPCFRREAGAAGKDTRGMLRTHQFDKVEMVRTCLPEESYNEFDKLLGHAEDVLQALGLHYRVLNLCTADIALQATKCYDLEVWAPGVNNYLEVSSCSNCEDFQARRANIRFRREKGAKPEFCHTLNASGVALPRLMVAVIETYQQADGTILLPEAIRPYMGCERIG